LEWVYNAILKRKNLQKFRGNSSPYLKEGAFSPLLVNETENNGYQPLHIAIKKGYDDAALILIQNGANVTYRDRSGYDPFELAISTANMKLAHAIYKAGYPYCDSSPQSIKLLQHQTTLHEFERQLR
jgi:hypothetical protein